MKFKATLLTESKNPEGVSRAVDVDNIKLDGLEINTRISGGSVETMISSNSLPSLLSTLDDLLRCQIMAEGLV